MKSKYMAMFAVSWLTFSLSAAQTVDERSAADANGVVEVSVVEGTVTVHGWKKNEIEITGTLSNNVEKLVFERDGARALIKLVYYKNAKRGDDKTRLQIRIPQQSKLNVNVVSADLEVEKVYGEQHIIGVSSDITTQVQENELNVQVVSGDTKVNGAGKNTRMHLTSVSGDINAHNIGGELEFASVSGDLVVKAPEMVRVRAKTTNGDIFVHADLAKKGRLDLNTINGDVIVDIEKADGLAVDIETMNGDISECFGETALRKHKYGPGRSLRFTNGDGSRKVSIDTLNGDVDICN